MSQSKDHDIKKLGDNWVFSLIYIGLSIVLSFLELYWLIVLVIIHLALDIFVEFHNSERNWAGFKHAIITGFWEIKVDLVLIMLSIVAYIYMSSAMGILGVNKAAKGISKVMGEGGKGAKIIDSLKSYKIHKILCRNLRNSATKTGVFTFFSRLKKLLPHRIALIIDLIRVPKFLTFTYLFSKIKTLLGRLFEIVFKKEFGKKSGNEPTADEKKRSKFTVVDYLILSVGLLSLLMICIHPIVFGGTLSGTLHHIRMAFIF